MSETLFEKIGGESALADMTYFLYANIMRDARLKPYFDNINIQRQMIKMQVFLTKILCDNTSYGVTSLQEIHINSVAQGLNDKDLDAMIECVTLALKEMHMSNNIIGEVKQKIRASRGEIVELKH